MFGDKTSWGRGVWRRVGRWSWRIRRAGFFSCQLFDPWLGIYRWGERGRLHVYILFPSLTFLSSGGLSGWFPSLSPPLCARGKLALNQTCGRWCLGGWWLCWVVWMAAGRVLDVSWAWAPEIVDDREDAFRRLIVSGMFIVDCCWVDVLHLSAILVGLRILLEECRCNILVGADIVIRSRRRPL